MTDAQITDLLREVKTIAVVGQSRKPWRPSFGVSSYMQAQGYRIIPVNPHIEESLGEQAHQRLEDVPEKVDIVNIFRQPAHVATVVDSAIKLGVRCIWMQEGVADQQAADLAEAVGIPVLMNRCILKYHRRLLGERKDSAG